MVDVITNKRIEVIGKPLTGAHLMVPVEQVSAIGEALAKGGVKFWVGDTHFSYKDEPPVVFVQLSRGTNAVVVQGILDGI